VLLKCVANVESLRYVISFKGERRAMAPLVVVMRSSCSGIVACAARSAADGSAAGRRTGGVVRGRSVIVVGRWPPRENVVRWRRRWPWRDLGSVFH
jgi:hypothetical protein